MAETLRQRAAAAREARSGSGRADSRGAGGIALAALILIGFAPVEAAARAPEQTLALKPEARAHLDAGLQAYHERHYELAIREVLTAQTLDPRPELDYTLGQIERHRGNCPGAVTHYRAYLEAAPDPESARAAQSQIDACATEAPPKLPLASPPSLPLPPPQPWYRDAAGGALIGAGALLAGAAIGLLVDSSARARDGRASYDGFASARTWVPVEEGIGIASAALSAVLLTGGVVRWADRARPRLSAQIGPGRAGLAIGGAF